MALLWNSSVNGFTGSLTSSALGPFAVVNGTWTINAGSGPNGINNISATSGYVAPPNISIAGGTGVVVGVGITVSAAPSGFESVFTLGQGSNDLVQIGANGSMIYSSFANGIEFTTPSGSFGFGSRHWLELYENKVSSGGNTATVSLYVDGVLKGTKTTCYTGQGFATLTAIDYLANFGGPTVTFDSFYVMDTTGSVNNFPCGPKVCWAYKPASNGTYTSGFATGGSAASLWQGVDNVPPNGDTSYVTDGTANDRLSTNMTSSVSPASVVGLTVSVTARQENSGGGRSLLAGVLESGTDNYGATVSLGTSYATSSTTFSTNPNNSNSPWAPGDLASTQAVIKVAS